MDRASAFEAAGRRFESCRACQCKKPGPPKGRLVFCTALQYENYVARTVLTSMVGLYYSKEKPVLRWNNHRPTESTETTWSSRFLLPEGTSLQVRSGRIREKIQKADTPGEAGSHLRVLATVVSLSPVALAKGEVLPGVPMQKARPSHREACFLHCPPV